ncbi:hypothetical protein ABZ092_09985 [Streptomyces bobili]|uniref:hypothetical protein n=1 Tax=Streptomyces bobili TaxID=67280 RepID=UPI0033BAF3FF
MVALALMLGATVLGCGAGSDGDEAVGDAGDTGGAATSSAADVATGDGASAEERIEQVNETMRDTPFSGLGTTTAYDGLQRIVWNPAQGLHISSMATGPDVDGGDMYCKDGVTYTSSSLLAAGLESRGVQISVPDRLDDVYVTSETGQGCEAYFAISPTGTFAPDKDATLDGVRAQAVVASSGSTSDTYFVSAEDPARLLKLKSVRDGRTSSTTYFDFGMEKDVTPPSPDKTMSMEEFRTEVDAD